MKHNTDEEKLEYLKQYDKEDAFVPEEEREKFRAIVEEGCEKDWPLALKLKGYGCYTGNEVFAQDWATSRDCLLKLAALTDDAYAYNSLGYIYYYGRCTGGKPEYEKAFQCFSVGAANGIYESRYKLADMFLGGKGCIPSKSAGANLIMSMYWENREHFCKKHYGCKFADVALRMAGLFERGDGVEQNFGLAYLHYLEARCAIRKRMAHHDHYGDAKVEKGIEEGLARVKQLLPKEYFTSRPSFDQPFLIGELMRHSAGMEITLSGTAGNYLLQARSYANDDASGCTMVAIPGEDFCELVSSVTLRLASDAEVSRDELPYQAFVTEMNGNVKEKTERFAYRNMTMLEIKCGKYTLESCQVAED